MHDIRYVEKDDEVVVCNPFASAIMTFRGGADGQEGPIRIIQGQNSLVGGAQRLDVDAIHDEIFVPRGNRVLVYPRKANGDVAPIRIIQGPDTQLQTASLAVDPVNDVLVVASGASILIFNRTDNGNVKPKAVIKGPKTGIIRINQMVVYPPRREIVLAMPGLYEQMEPKDAFLGVWTYDDNGDVAPKWKLPVGAGTTLKKPFGVVLNPKFKEVIISDMRRNGVLTFLVPEIF